MADPGAKIGGAGAGVAASYRLAGTGRLLAEDERLSLLEEVFDTVSIRRRSLVQAGWRCLEVGAGRFARPAGWLLFVSVVGRAQSSWRAGGRVPREGLLVAADLR